MKHTPADSLSPIPTPVHPEMTAEHSRTDDASTSTRRTALTTIATVATTGVVGLGMLAGASEPAAAVDGDPVAFEAGDAPTVTSNAGQVESVFLSPRVEVVWTDFSAGVDTVELTLAVGSETGVDEVYRETVTAAEPESTSGDIARVAAFDHGAVDGELTVELDRVDATDRGDAVTSEALSDPTLAGGETATTTLDIVLRADVSGGGDETTVLRTTTVDIAVTNPAGAADSGGSVEIETA